MEQNLSTLTFKGSIIEAISEAKRQKKLFVVYLSGETEQSVRLEELTWTDSSVAESVSKYCILLHIKYGSADAENFLAIYPQNSFPCIIAIGFNGLQIWRTEGFVNAKDLASSLEKAWLSLHIQETTAGILTVALASKEKSESSGLGVTTVGSSSGGSLDVNTPSPVTETIDHSPKAPTSVKLGSSNENETCKQSEKASDDNLTSDSVVGSKTSSLMERFSASSTSTAKTEGMSSGSTSYGKPENQLLVSVGEKDSDVSQDSGHHHPSTASEKNADHHVGMAVDIKLGLDKSKEPEWAGTGPEESTIVERKPEPQLISESSEVLLNIRLPDGANFKEKFHMTNLLQTVMDYVDRNRVDGAGSYDLAIPYPRKVFTNQDLSKSLSELGLLNRQALIVVPHQKGTIFHRGGSSPAGTTSYTDRTGLQNGAEGGYFAFVRRMISYINPFSYFGGSAGSSPGQPSETSMWEHGPNLAFRNNFPQRDSSDTLESSNGSSSANTNNVRRRTSGFGGNIHTLRGDQDDTRFRDRNAFWNGNSTQYRGDNSSR